MLVSDTTESGTTPPVPEGPSSRSETSGEKPFRVELSPREGAYLRVGKRMLDVVASSIMLILLSPLFLIVAICIKRDSPGPVFYRCDRVGLGGEHFTFLKFRSMCEGARERKADLQDLNEVDGPVFKVSDDPRITGVGRFLRRSSIDELPQLMHVLTGKMSLVGPRPPEPGEVRQYETWQLRRLSVVPGITCLWQISGRSLIGFDEWMRLDLEYIDNRCFSLDFKILIRTLPAVLSGKGAY